MAGKLEAEHVTQFQRIFVWREPGGGGDTFAKGVPARLRAIGFRGDVREVCGVDLGVKDASDLWCQNPDKKMFKATLAEAMRSAKEVRAGAVSFFESYEALRVKQPPLTFLVDQLVELPSTVLLFGATGGGKTFVAVDLAAAGATGGEWYGGRKVASGPVFYVAGEGRPGLLRRIQAWELARNVKIPADRLFLSTRRIDLDADGAAAVAVEIDRLSAACGLAPVLVIVDTIARALPAGADENSAKDMGAFINVMDGIRDRFRCVVVLVHHTGQADQNRARGSSALKAAMDAELCVSRKGNVHHAEWTKLKDLPEEPAPLAFILESQDVGPDDVKEPITSAAVVWRGAHVARPTDTEELGLQTLRDAMAENGGGPVTEAVWREGFMAVHGGKRRNDKRTAFSRVRHSLVNKRLIAVDGGQVALSPSAGLGLPGSASSASMRLNASREAFGQSASSASPPLRGEALRRPPRKAGVMTGKRRKETNK